MSWQYTERLTNEEFEALLPHLGLDQMFLTQVYAKQKNKWVRLIDVDFRKVKVLCAICSQNLEFQYIRRHYKSKEHNDLMASDVTQYYHPFYTYGKFDKKFAFPELDDDVSLVEKEHVLKEVNSHVKSFSRDALTGSRFIDMVNSVEQRSIDSYLIRIAVNDTIDTPDHMYIRVELPFDNIGELLFLPSTSSSISPSSTTKSASKAKGTQWQRVFKYNSLSKKGSFRCVLCSITCRGIGSVNSHLNGYTHRTEQLLTDGVRFKKSKKITKNCCIQFENEYKLTIHKDAMRHYKEALQKMQSTDKDGNHLEFIKVLDISKEIDDKVKKLNDLQERINNRNKNNDSQGASSVDKSGVKGKKTKKEFCLGQIGVEYVIKIISDDPDIKPIYECCLCEYVTDEGSMQKHILNYDHRKKYLELHYLSTVRKYEGSIGHMKFTEYRVVMMEIMKRIAIEIEAHHGRSLPYTINSKDYEFNRLDIIEELNELQHASQARGPSFSQIVSIDEIKDLKKVARQGNKGKNSGVETSEITFTESMEDKTYLNQISNEPTLLYRSRKKTVPSKRKDVKRKHSPILSKGDRHLSRDLTNRRRVPQRRELRNSSRSRSPLSLSPPSPSHHDPSGSDEVERLDTYRRGGVSPTLWNKFYEELSVITETIERKYTTYRKNPENHPQYEDEWNEFWQRRKLELERDGVNYRSYNFQPEWVQYFKKRIEQLFDYEMQNIRDTLYHKFNIPLNDVPMNNYRDILNEPSRHCDEVDMEDETMEPPQLHSTYFTTVEELSDRNNLMEKTAKLRPISQNRHGDPHHLYNNHHDVIDDHDDYNRYPVKRQRNESMKFESMEKPPMRDSSREMVATVPSMNSTSSSSANNSSSSANLDSGKMSSLTDNHSNLVHVLRLITALEDHLGSLGNKVMDLLAIALKLEKNFQGNITEFESQILTATNCNMLETAVEKLKGILFAGLVDSRKISGFNRVIQVTTELLNYADQRGWRQDVNIPSSKVTKKPIVPLMSENSNEIQSSTGGGGGGGGPLMRDHQPKSIPTGGTINKEFGGYNNDHQSGASCPPPPQIKMNPSNLFDGDGKDRLHRQELSGASRNQQSLRYQMEKPRTNVLDDDYMRNKPLPPRLTLQHRDADNGNNESRTGLPMAPVTAHSIGGGREAGTHYMDMTRCRYSNSNSGNPEQNMNIMGSGDHLRATGARIGDGGSGGIPFNGMNSNEVITNRLSSRSHMGGAAPNSSSNLIMAMQQIKGKQHHHPLQQGGGGGGGGGGEVLGVNRIHQKLPEKQSSHMSSWNPQISSRIQRN